ncbi:MAG: hypothetical protein WBO35_03660 [Candidatus Saccharimonadales bacterium]|jgi:hypothetical protein
MIFGHQNNASAKTVDDSTKADDNTTGADPLRLDPTDTVTTPSQLDDLDAPVTAAAVLNQDPTPSATNASLSTDAPVTSPTVVPAAEPATALEPDTTPADSLSVVEPPLADDLLNLKQEALTQLTPLVDHLEQTPEERFRTTMMMIQSADNSALIKDAYAAAQEIKDDKVRAQALLDIVNEINYFTHKKDK